MFEKMNIAIYRAIPTLCELDFSKKSSLLSGYGKIISNISYSQSNNTLFKVKIINKKDNFYAIFQKFNLYIVGIGDENSGFITNNLDDVRYLSTSDFSLSKESIGFTFNKITSLLKKDNPKDIFKFFTESNTAKDVRIFIFSVAEVAKNELLKEALFLNLKLTTFRDITINLNLFPSAIEREFKYYNNFLIFILNWQNINSFKGVLLPRAITLFEIREYFSRQTLFPKDKELLKKLGVLL